MTGSRPRAAPFLCPPLPLSRGQPPPAPFLHRPVLPAASLSETPPAPAPSTSPLYCLSPRQGPHPQVPPAPTPPDPSSPPLLPPSGAPSPKHHLHRPSSLHLSTASSPWRVSLPEAPLAPAPSTPPLCCLFLPAGPLPKVPPVPPAPASSEPLSPGGAPSPRRLPHQPFLAPASPTPLPPGGDHLLKFFLHRVPLLPPSPLSKTDLEGRLSAPPGRTRAFLGSFRAFSGTFWAFPGGF